MITDPDLLTKDTEVVFNTTNKTIELVIAGNLDATGVTLQAVYSFCKDVWKADTDLIKFPFPILAITEEKFEIISGWNWLATGSTKTLIRTGGWAVNPSGTVTEEWAGIISLGSIGSGQAYHQQASTGDGAVATNFVLTGAVNQAVKIWATGDTPNYRTYFKIFCREYGKSYVNSSIGDIGVTTMTYQVYRFPLSNADDLKIAVTDANLIGNTPYFETATLTLADGSVTISDPTITSAIGGFIAGDVGKYICIDTGTNAGFYKIITYTDTNNVDVDRNFGATGSSISFTVNPIGMAIEWFAAGQSKSGLVGGPYNFHVVIDGNGGTAEQIYTFVQYQLRQNNDIDVGSGSTVGKVAPGLMFFVGDALYTQLYAASQGTFMEYFADADTNRLYFADDTFTTTYRVFPYVSLLTINFGQNLIDDTGAKYWVFFTNDNAGSDLGYDYGTANAILVNKSGSFTTVNRARAANVATIETATAHGLLVGEGVDISGVTNVETGNYNGDYIVTVVPDTTHFKYANTGGAETEVADTGGTIKENMVANISGASSIACSFDYTNNLQRGAGSDGEDAPITVVAIGLAKAQFVIATGTIEATKTNQVSLVAPLERNYL